MTALWPDMRRRDYLTSAACGLATGFAGCSSIIRDSGAATDTTTTTTSSASDPPNVVVILVDDMGYGDPGCFGPSIFQTPNLDRMATNGIKLTSFYSTPICTTTRAALLTGKYPKRVAFGGTVGPDGDGGLAPSVATIADVVGASGYATGCFGKWHLGHDPRERYLPTNQGFDRFFGIPYSNSYAPSWKEKYPPLPLIRGTQTIKQSINQRTMTKRFTEETIEFVTTHARQDEPFFCYLAHAMPHAPIHTTDRFQGTSPVGPYGDAVRELDFYTGRLLDRLDQLGVGENTLVVFTSDNGPWKVLAGSNGPFRGHKGEVLEGGVRVPTIARWPEAIPAGTTSTAVASVIDLFPTIEAIAGLDGERSSGNIDGANIMPMLRQPTTATSPHEYFSYTRPGWDWGFGAVRRDRWKLHLNRDSDGQVVPAELYNLKQDRREQHDRSASHSETVADLHSHVADLNRTLS